MSGIDEQEIDIPICPECRERPAFWILYQNEEARGFGGWFWLHSKTHMEQTDMAGLEMVNGKNILLEDTKVIHCRPISGTPSWTYHSFTPENQTFQKVMKMARRLSSVERP